MAAFDAPDHLVAEIKRGRCVAFVGAGFSAPVVPDWKGLLDELAKRARAPELENTTGETLTALEYEMRGQLLKEKLGSSFERHVCEILDKRVEVEGAPTVDTVDSAYRHGRPAVMSLRRRLLNQIPFKAVLTLNVDPLLTQRGARGDIRAAEADATARWDVLRGDLAWWERADPDGRFEHRTPTLKLHGDANGRASRPVVLGRSDYRRLLYEDGRYANFLRAVFASHTVLFVGVSFTDAYLNEIRSELLAFLQAESNPTPWYAILGDHSSNTRAYFKQHEGIEVLHYDSNGAQDFSGFDRWLEAIHSRTSTRRRIAALVGGRKIVWIDPSERSNWRGISELREADADVEILRSVADLRPQHAGADLILTRFNYRGPDDAEAFDVMAHVGRWPNRPPVIAFATGDFAEKNREAFLRRGGWEYASGWQELFRLIELLFGRRTRP